MSNTVKANKSPEMLDPQHRKNCLTCTIEFAIAEFYGLKVEENPVAYVIDFERVCQDLTCVLASTIIDACQGDKARSNGALYECTKLAAALINDDHGGIGTIH